MSPGVTGAPVCECPPSPRLLRPQEVSPSTCDPRTPGIDVSKLFHGSVGPSTASVECFTPWRPAVGSMLMTGSDRSVILTFRGKPAPPRTPPAILPPARKWRESQRPRGGSLASGLSSKAATLGSHLLCRSKISFRNVTGRTCGRQSAAQQARTGTAARMCRGGSGRRAARVPGAGLPGRCSESHVRCVQGGKRPKDKIKNRSREFKITRKRKFQD